VLDILAEIYDSPSNLRRLAEFKRTKRFAPRHDRPLSVVMRQMQRWEVIGPRAEGFGPGRDLFPANNVFTGASITVAERGLKRAWDYEGKGKVEGWDDDEMLPIVEPRTEA